MDSNEIAYREHIDLLLKNQSRAIADAQRFLFKNDLQNRSKKLDEGELTEFPIGSLVLVKYHNTGLGTKPPSKLHPKWEGPFKVMNITNSGNTYVLQNFVDGGITNRHITDLKIFHYDEELTHLTLSDIALRDRIHEFPVENVISHRFKRKEDGLVGNRSSDLEFHIHWKGFSSRWDTWEPFKNVRLSTIVIDYMRGNRLKRFIPRNLEEDAVTEDEQSVSVVNRIKDKDIKRNEKKTVRFLLPLQTNYPLYPESEKRWVRNKRTSSSWIDSEEIRFLGPL